MNTETFALSVFLEYVLLFLDDNEDENVIKFQLVKVQSRYCLAFA